MKTSIYLMTITDEEKLRRAIEISARRNNNYRINTTARVKVDEKKEYKLFKKMILQIIICLLIYIIFYLITTTNYVFSADVIKNTKEILNNDINFQELYNSFILFISPKIDSNQTEEFDNSIQNSENILENNVVQNTTIIENNSVLTENIVEDKKNETADKDNGENVEESKTQDTAKTQMELDAEAVAKVCKFQKPLSGIITSEFGDREAIIDGMTTDHKGIDIAANLGTSIKAVMGGTVSVAEENSEYGKFIKIVKDDVMTVYAHCQKLKVKVGDKIKEGQTIATVGSTGTSTGPHLHLEIRYKNRYINPKLLIEF